MANNLSNAARTAFETFYQTIANTQQSWQAIATPLTVDAPTYKESIVTGITTYSAQAASPTPIDIKSSASSTNAAAYEKVVKLSRKEIRDTPGILSNVAGSLASAGMETLSNAFWETFTNLDGVAHAHAVGGAGGYDATGDLGGTVNFCDDFTMTPTWGAGDGSDNFTQKNLDTLALTTTSLSTLFSRRHAYLDPAGMRLAKGSQLPKLVVYAGDETKALSFASRNMEVFMGGESAAETNLAAAMGGRLGGVVVVPGGITNQDESGQNDWFLVWSSSDGGFSCPVQPWLRVPPTVSIAADPASNYVFIKAYMEYAIHLKADEGNVFMNEVA